MRMTSFKENISSKESESTSTPPPRKTSKFLTIEDPSTTQTLS